MVLPLNDWASQKLLSKIVGAKIKQLGYHVEYLPISSVLQLGALRKGLVHLQVEVWQSHDDGEIMQAINRGYIDDLGLHSAKGREDWWYPEYVEDLCPGLPNWEALKACSSLFIQENSGNKGVFISGPWNYRDADLIHALELNFTIKRLQNAEQIWSALQRAEKEKQPIVLLNWTPNWLDVRINGRFVEFPSFEKACEEDPKWGINKHMTHDCGNPPITYIKKVAWPGLKQQWPCLYQFAQKIDFTTAMISEASALFGQEKRSEEEAIRLWLSKYGEQSKSWLDFYCPN